MRTTLSGFALSVCAAAALLAACSGSQSPLRPLSAIPQANAIVTNAARDGLRAEDGSILKKLKKDIVIGSTIDPSNGDTGPRSIAVVRNCCVLQRGQLLVCNFTDKSGTPGNGTTIEVLNPKRGSKPKTFAQSDDIKGCDGDAVTLNNGVFGAGFTSRELAEFSAAGQLESVLSGRPFSVPFSDYNNGLFPQKYRPNYVWVSDAKTGSIIAFSLSAYGAKNPVRVATGFAVNDKGSWNALGPSGLQYDAKTDHLYIADGVDNTVVEFTHASHLGVRDEIIVEPGGKTFKCKYSTTCGKLIYAGKPLDAPVAMTLLPNGNLIAANSRGGNTLIEFTPEGKVLDTKIVDKSKSPGIFGLAATGKNDDDTTVFFTDTNFNNLQELER